LGRPQIESPRIPLSTCLHARQHFEAKSRIKSHEAPLNPSTAYLVRRDIFHGPIGVGLELGGAYRPTAFAKEANPLITQIHLFAYTSIIVKWAWLPYRISKSFVHSSVATIQNLHFFYFFCSLSEYWTEICIDEVLLNLDLIQVSKFYLIVLSESCKNSNGRRQHSDVI